MAAAPSLQWGICAPGHSQAKSYLSRGNRPETLRADGCRLRYGRWVPPFSERSE